MHEVLPDSAATANGRLVVGGCDAVELAERFGTPLVVFDRATFEARAGAYAAAVTPERVFYAGKAFCCVAVCELLDELGLGLDVCSGGELATAVAAGLPGARIVFHGNNKSLDELRLAKQVAVGRIVADSFEEIDAIDDLEIPTRVLVRVTPGVEAHTHEYVQTGQEDSKFGFSLADGLALEAVKRALQLSRGELVGVHAHIGSQIFEFAAFDLAIERIAGFLSAARDELGFAAQELNLGGGLGVAHTRDETTPDVVKAVEHMVAAVDREFTASDLEVPEVFVEPGRSIVGQAAVTLYRVGTIKRIPGVRTYVSVDGGMSDNLPTKGSSSLDRTYVAVDGGMGENIRPALYGARYEAFLANRMDDPPGRLAHIVGRYCESGDYLIQDASLPEDVGVGDLLCIPATGAYTYSMASNYNRVPRPAVVMVEDGNAIEIIRRETSDDMYRLDRRLDGSGLAEP